MGTILTPDQMRDLLSTLLEGAAGGTHDEWRHAVGPVEKLTTHLNMHCNWTVHPEGNRKQITAIERAVDIVRIEHPYVAP